MICLVCSIGIKFHLTLFYFAVLVLGEMASALTLFYRSAIYNQENKSSKCKKMVLEMINMKV